LRIKQIIAEEIPTRLLAHSEQIHSARRYLSIPFFCLLICWNYVEIIVDLTEILSSWLEIKNLRNGQFLEFELLCCAPARICITKLLVMASKLQLI
jgi:hypothetical protein